MKLSPPSSSTSTTSSSFGTSKANNFGCLSGFLSRILGFKTSSSHPQKPHHFFNILDHSTTPTSSNVVAKLMGLDSIPHKETEEMHRRPKTSFSFKETPDFFELQDDDFFLPTHTQTKRKRKKKKKKNGLRGSGRKQSKEENRVFSIEDRLSLKISAQNSHIRNQSYHLSPLKENPTCRREESDGIKTRKNKIKEIECESENLSPVSVLDHSEFISDPEAATSEEDVKIGGCEERGMWEEREREGDCELMIKQSKHEMVSRVNRLAEAEIANDCNSSMNYRDRNRGMLRRTQELEDATTHFGQLIFDHLLSELVHQLHF